VDANASVTTLAGTAGDPGYNGTVFDGTGTAAHFYYPRAVVANAAGDAYIADYANSTIRKITTAGVVTTLAGIDRTCSTANGTGTAAGFCAPSGITLVGSDLYVADTGNNLIRKVTSGGVVTTIAGSGTAASTDGTGTGASFNQPYSIDADSQGNLLVVDQAGRKIRKVTPAGVVTTLAGSGNNAGDDGTGSAASFYNPAGIAIDSNDNAFVTDAYSIRKITPAGVVTTYAGNAFTSGSNN
jgi:hypothetical protein